jgi:23S rRNA (uracil1939-C5)-methyltransferase
VDLYCGAGAIALHLAPQFQTVYGVELVPEAIVNANQNAARNHITNISFHCGEVQKVLPGLLPGQPELIVIDPPRAGLSKKVVRHILSAAARQILYVSCNPATLARDLTMFTEGGYVVEEVQPIDMFPHTYHIETVVKLSEKREES